ncbi:MAG: hypothetical protein IJ538_03955 [Clostridia bacterium]|nr:hypothetical protein [Clostridia bacterium]
MKKFKTTVIVTLIANWILIFLTAFYLNVPNQIPIMFDWNENAVLLGSKLWLLLTLLPVTIFGILSLSLKNKRASVIFYLLFLCNMFVNMLTIIYYLCATDLSLGSKAGIPFGISIFLPLSMILLVWSSKLKTIEYKSWFGLKIIKKASTTQFIWTQTHIFANKVFVCTNLILTVLSLALSFLRIPWIILIIFVVAYLFALAIVAKFAADVTKRYNYMKERQDKLDEMKKNKKI